MKLIDADALLNREVYYDRAECLVLRYEIEKAPTIEAEPVRHGRWIEAVRWIRTDGHKKSLRWMRCSACGFRAKPKFAKNYCPNCGTKMDKENDNG